MHRVNIVHLVSLCIIVARIDLNWSYFYLSTTGVPKQIGGLLLWNFWKTFVMANFSINIIASNAISFIWNYESIHLKTSVFFNWIVDKRIIFLRKNITLSYIVFMAWSKMSWFACSQGYFFTCNLISKLSVLLMLLLFCGTCFFYDV